MEYFVMVKVNDLKPNISSRMHLTNDIRGKKANCRRIDITFLRLDIIK